MVTTYFTHKETKDDTSQTGIITFAEFDVPDCLKNAINEVETYMKKFHQNRIRPTKISSDSFSDAFIIEIKYHNNDLQRRL